MENSKEGKIIPWMRLHGEWASLMALLGAGIVIMVVCFVYAVSKIEKTNDRLDSHMQSNQERMVSINQRADDLHREFYELLKEMRRER